jgi:hypothetical protein
VPAKKSSKTLTAVQTGLKYGFRSGLEEKIAASLTSKGVRFTFEELTVPFVEPAKTRKYTPDFVLENGIIIESKGRFLTEDRQKHLLVKAQRPDLDIRFVFSNSKAKINKRSTTTYGDWCEKNGFLYADKDIPEGWLREKPKKTSA